MPRESRTPRPGIATFQVVECENGGWCILMPGEDGEIRIWKFEDPAALGIHIGALLGAPATISRPRP